MCKPKLLITHNEFPQEIIDTLTEKFDVQIINKHILETTKEDLLDNIPGKFGLLMSSMIKVLIDEDVIDAAGSSLKVISTTSMGYDTIDINALRKRQIKLGNTTLATTHRVSELTLGLLIATARNLMDANIKMKSGKLPESYGMGVTNSIVGIIGCGNIGIALAKMLSTFKLQKLLYTSRKSKPDVECLGGELVSVDDLVGRSDFIILTSVLVPETMFIINKDRLALMKTNAVIINVGRGELIDQDALIDALREKRIRGAGLDVMTPEPLPLNSPLITMDNVLLLPHIAGRNSLGSDIEKSKLAADNLLAVYNNQPMPCEVKL